MPLEKRPVDIPFAGGRNADIDPKLLPPGQLLKIENGYYDRRGEVRRRNGGNALGTDTVAGGSLSRGSWIAGHRDELLLCDGEDLYSYSTTRDEWVDKGAVSPASISVKSVAVTRQSSGRIEFADVGQYRCYLHSDPVLNPVITLVDTVTGAELLSSQRVDPLSLVLYPVIVPAATHDQFVIFFKEGASNVNIGYTVVSNVSSGAPTLSAAATIKTDCVLTSDVKATEFGDDIAICYEQAATGFFTAVRYAYLAGTWTLQATYTYTVGAAGKTIGYDLAYVAAHARIYASIWHRRAGVIADLEVTRLPVSMVADYAPALVELTPALETNTTGADYAEGWAQICADVTIATSIHVVWSTKLVTQREYRTKHATVTAAGVVDSPYDLARNAVMVSNPFVFDGSVYLFVHRHDPTPTDSTAPANLSNVGSVLLIKAGILGAGSTTVARALVGEHPNGLVTKFNRPLLPRPVSVSGNVISIALIRAEASALAPGSTYALSFESTIQELTVDMTKQRQPTIDVNGVMMIAAGVLSVYDSGAVNAAGFHMVHPAFNLEGNGAGSFADGTYGVAIVYRWHDAAGNVYYSAPTYQNVTLAGGPQALSITSAAGTVDWAANNGLSDLPDIDLLVYVTAVGGSVYHYYSSYDNVPAVYHQTIALTAGTNTNNALLYTDGGLVSAILPPTAHHIATDGNTVALVPGDRRDTVWVSVPVIRSEGVRFSDSIAYYVPEAGQIEAVEWVGGRLILLAKDQIRYMVGDAPNALGLGGYSGSRNISRKVGCEDWRSVVNTPRGLVFKNARGFHLLTPGLQVSDIGEPVRDYKGQTVSGSTVIEDEQQVRFAMSSGDVLVWDYRANIWSVYIYAIDVIDLATAGGVSYGLASTPVILAEDSGAWGDATVRYTLKVRTAWIKPSAVAGFGRIWKAALTGAVRPQTHLTEADIDDHIEWRVYSDYSTAAYDTLYSGWSSDLGAAVDSPLLVRASLERQKVSAVMFEWEIYSRYKFNEGLRLSSLSLDLGIDKGLARLAQSKSV